MVSLTVMLFVSPARADMFGGDVAMLAQILLNAIQQLAQLKSIVDNGKDNIELLRDINRGINDSLALIRTVSPNSDPGLYKDWEKVSDALTKVEDIYGIAVPSKDLPVQRDTDQSVAEAVSLNNSIYKYTKEIDEIGELIKAESHSVSPGGAAKLTAQSLGVMLNVQNQMLRTQATGLKLQAQTMALANRKDKEQTRTTLENGRTLKEALASQPTKFELPRF
jgi:hypothetical protein